MTHGFQLNCPTAKIWGGLCPLCPPADTPMEDADEICFTFDSYFCDWNGQDLKSLKDKIIFLEEFSMISSKWKTKIYKAFIKFNNTVYMYGNPN